MALKDFIHNSDLTGNVNRSFGGRFKSLINDVGSGWLQPFILVPKHIYL